MIIHNWTAVKTQETLGHVISQVPIKRKPETKQEYYLNEQHKGEHKTTTLVDITRNRMAARIKFRLGYDLHLLTYK